jgi:hypothetical protein
MAISLVAMFGLLAILAVNAIASNADILSYQRGVTSIVDGRSPYAPSQVSGPYQLGTVSWGRGFVYPPTSVGILWPTALGVIGIFKLVNASALLIVVAVLAWRLTGRPSAVGAAIALTLAHPGMHVREGQVEPLIAAGIGALWLWPSGWLAVGGGLVKLHPFAGLVWAVRKGGSITPPLATGAAVIGIWALIAPDLWRDWMASTVNMRADCNAIGWPSVNCLTGIRWLGPALAGILLLGTWRMRSDKVAFLLLTLAIVVAAPDTYASYWLIPWVGALPLLLTEAGAVGWRPLLRGQLHPPATVRAELKWQSLPVAESDSLQPVPVEATSLPGAATIEGLTGGPQSVR